MRRVFWHGFIPAVVLLSMSGCRDSEVEGTSLTPAAREVCDAPGDEDDPELLI